MATLFASIKTKWDALAPGGFANSVVPPIHLDNAPQVTTAGLQLRPPWCLLSLIAGDNILCFEAAGIEETRGVFRLFDEEPNLDQAVAAIRWNAFPVGTGAGFDEGSLPTLTDGTLLSMILAKPPTKTYSGTNYDSQKLFVATLEYNISVQR